MKHLLPICVLLLSSITTYGQQQPTVGLRVVTPHEQQPDPTGQRLHYLRKTAFELEQSGSREKAAAVRQLAEFEQQALLRRLDSLQAEAQQIRQAIGVGTPVMVQLQIAEVSLTKLRSTGFDCSKLPGDPIATPNLNQLHGNAQSVFGMTDGTEAQQIFESLRKDNLIKIIAEPKLVTLSGKTGVFRAGEMLSIPKRQQDGTVTIEQRHGIEVEVTPEVLGDKIQLAFHGSLAEADHAHMMRVGKDSIPGVRLREGGTRTEFKSGQTLVLRGLVQVREESENSGVPYLSELPYVGVPFRKVRSTQNEIELFILVRPEIVQPLVPNSAPIAGMQENRYPPRATPLVHGPGISSPATTQRLTDTNIRR